MDQIILPVLVAFVITSIFVYPTIILVKKFGLMDDPNLRPHPAHVQKRVVPRAGGLACFMGLVITILFFLPVEKHIIGIFIGMTILLIVGLVDDKRITFSPYLRLGLQFLAALAVVASGVGILFITNPFGGIIRLDTLVFQLPLFGVHNVIIIADLLALIWIVWVMNMLNWSKGVDGQLPGITLVTSIVLGLLSLKLYQNGDPQQLNIAKLSFITSGVAFSFLIFNWYPAKIFPGFSGSSIFGLMIATIGILSGAKLATAGLALLIPAVDFLYTFIRRLIQKKSPVWGDRGHLHHKLLDLGLSHGQITCLYILVSAILGAAALSLDSRGKLFAAILSAASVIGLILWLNFFGALFKAFRPRQWIKNFALFSPLLFTGSLFNQADQLKALAAFLIFCGFSSATYLLNDVFDIERDKLHPFKKKRPIASGLISPTLAVAIALILVVILLPVSYALSPAFFLAGVIHLILQLFYSAYLKQVILLDVIVIATGFVLRVYAGVWAIDAHLNVWFLLSVTSFALFLAIGKRRSELTLMVSEASQHRETLLHYPENFLDILTSMFANSAWLTYALFAFLQPPISTPVRLTEILGTVDLPILEAKYFMATVPIVIYGVMRYLYIIYEKKEGESPERVLITDTPLLSAVLLWLIMVITINYYAVT